MRSSAEQDPTKCTSTKYIKAQCVPGITVICGARLKHSVPTVLQ